MRKGVIDLGTNTFNLLIADVADHDFQIVHTEKSGVALGMGGINRSIIVSDAIDRALHALCHFKKVCDQYTVQSIRAIGTSAIRDASNAAEFSELVKKETGIPIEIVSGKQEAELIYHGVKCTFQFTIPAVIMDIGGGSTEFIFADQKGIRDLVSLNIGVSRIFQEFVFNDPMTDADISVVEEWLEKQANGFFDQKEEDCLIGASGSFETFYELIYSTPFPASTKAVELNTDLLLDSLDKIICSTQQERDENEWIIPIRKKMAPIAAIKTRWIIRKLKSTKILISPYSLKEGALMT
jgi:exopolyphosphatase/guanosine-5'-triphosphate,3'-diphosphate pyrophosphatase